MLLRSGESVHPGEPDGEDREHTGQHKLPGRGVQRGQVERANTTRLPATVAVMTTRARMFERGLARSASAWRRTAISCRNDAADPSSTSTSPRPPARARRIKLATRRSAAGSASCAAKARSAGSHPAPARGSPTR